MFCLEFLCLTYFLFVLVLVSLFFFNKDDQDEAKDRLFLKSKFHLKGEDNAQKELQTGAFRYVLAVRPFW